MSARATCPCCAQHLKKVSEEGSTDLSEDRQGDRWCEFCHWIILQELEEPDFAPVECPTHGPLHQGPGPELRRH
jgi:hypothetical protein